MKLHIIHLRERVDRIQLLETQLLEQNITNHKLWDGILDRDNPAKGIARSHKQIIKWATKENLPSIVIAEDDVKFTAKGAYDYFLKKEPKEFDLYLGGITYGNINCDNSVIDFSGLHLYKINQCFYQTFLSLPEEENIDRALANKGKYIVCNPFVAIQHNGFSDNHKRYQNYELFWQNRQLFN